MYCENEPKICCPWFDEVNAPSAGRRVGRIHSVCMCNANDKIRKEEEAEWQSDFADESVE